MYMIKVRRADFGGYERSQKKKETGQAKLGS